MIFFVATIASCGGGSNTTGTSGSGGGGNGGGGGGGTTNSQPSVGHVFLVVEENHGFTDVVGSSSMPYLNSLINEYGLAMQYFADTHPSIGNYFMLTTGQIETNDDAFSGVVSDDNLVRELKNAGKSWRSYAESLPNAGYTGGDVYPYARHHNPFTYFSDVLNDSTEAGNLVPFSQFASDLTNNTLPNFSFILPDLLDDAHDGTLAQADTWLKQNIQPLLASTTFRNDGLLIITFDEAEDSDTSHGGGRIATVIISSKAKSGFQSQTLYQHESTLRLILSALGISNFPGNAANAPAMDEFFN